MARSAPAEPPPGLPPEEKDAGERYLTLIEHLQELRYRVMVSACAVVVGLCVSAVFANRIIVFLEQPAKDRAPADSSSSSSNRPKLRDLLPGRAAAGSSWRCLQSSTRSFAHRTRPQRRVALALRHSAGTGLFAGVAFSYYVALPPALNSVELQQRPGAAQHPAGQLYRLRDAVAVLTGVCFEMPLVAMYLARFRILGAADASVVAIRRGADLDNRGGRDAYRRPGDDVPSHVADARAVRRGDRTGLHRAAAGTSKWITPLLR